MNQEKLYNLDAEDWKMIESQYLILYKPVFAFVLQNKGSMSEARDVYVEAFLYYLQLLELRGIKLSQNAETIVYSFSRKVWLHKLEKRHVDLDSVRHRREFFEMDDAFQQIDSINARSFKTAEKLAEIGEPCRTLMLECVGRRKDLPAVAMRLGFSDDNRAFNNLGQCIAKLIKTTEGKEFQLPEGRFAELLRYALDGMESSRKDISDEERVVITMISRVVAMVRNHVTRSERIEHFRQIQDRVIPQTLNSIDEVDEEEYNEKGKFMKSIVVIGIATLLAFGVSALTAFTISEAVHKKHVVAGDETDVVADSVEVEIAVPEVVHYKGLSAFAVANGGYLITTAKPVLNAGKITVTGQDGEVEVSIVASDTTLNLALLKMNDLPQGSARIPYRFASQPTGLGEHLYTIGFPEGALQYSDGSLSAIAAEGSIINQVQLTSVSLGAPVMEAKGQVAGMIVSEPENGVAKSKMIGAVRMTEWLLQIVQRENVELHMSSRNGLFYSERPRQIEQLQPFVYVLNVYPK